MFHFVQDMYVVALKDMWRAKEDREVPTSEAWQLAEASTVQYVVQPALCVELCQVNSGVGDSSVLLTASSRMDN